MNFTKRLRDTTSSRYKMTDSQTRFLDDELAWNPRRTIKKVSSRYLNQSIELPTNIKPKKRSYYASHQFTNSSENWDNYGTPKRSMQMW